MWHAAEVAACSVEDALLGSVVVLTTGSRFRNQSWHVANATRGQYDLKVRVGAHHGQASGSARL